MGDSVAAVGAGSWWMRGGGNNESTWGGMGIISNESSHGSSDACAAPVGASCLDASFFCINSLLFVVG